MPEKIYKTSRDGILGISIFMLFALGMVMLFSASYHRSLILYHDPLRFFLNQISYGALGLLGLVVFNFLPVNFFRKAAPFVLLLSLILLIMPFIPGLGAEYLGGRRWIRLGNYSFQPVELIKISMVLYIASYFTVKAEDFETNPFRTLLPPLGILTLICVMVFFQNDFSSALFIFILGMSMFFAAGVPLRYFVGLLIILIPVLVWVVYSKEHRLERILTYLNLQADPLDAGYQVLASLSALQKGGLAGVGIGQGVKKLGTLPEAQSDFIFAVLGEELGFIGVFLVIALFAIVAWRGYHYCMQEEDIFKRMVVFGLTSALVLQAVINLGVVSSLLPATGMTLPFFSSGGSSLLASLCMAGILLGFVRTGTKVLEGGEDE